MWHWRQQAGCGLIQLLLHGYCKSVALRGKSIAWAGEFVMINAGRPRYITSTNRGGTTAFTRPRPGDACFNAG